MKLLPIPKRAAKETLGSPNNQQATQAANKIQRFNVKNQVKNNAATFLQGIASDTITELVDNLN